MSATAEAVTEATKKAAKKTAVKKTPKKAAPKKVAAKKTSKAAPKKVAKKSAASTTARSAAAGAKATRSPGGSGKRGRPAGKKTGTRRVKKGAKQFAYLLLTAQDDGSQKASSMQGPFITEAGALEDASIMADDATTIVLFRETKRGKVQKQTKFVAGR